LAELETFEKNKPDGDFFEDLTKEIRKSGIWIQQKLYKITKEEMSYKEKKLETLKKDFNARCDEIFLLERQIQKIRETDLKEKLKSLKIFECINAERANPHFLNIAKKTKSDETTGSIQKDNGDEFESEKEREDHILKFYSDLYKKDVLVTGSIEDFLGEDILRHPLVRASKLTEGEKNNLDLPLTFEEIEKSLRQVNMKSAPGIDGFSYKFITKFTL
jgi:hypothetical protein